MGVRRHLAAPHRRLLHDRVQLFLRVLRRTPMARRSEEHTSELQSRLHLVCRLLLEKKKTDPKLVAALWRVAVAIKLSLGAVNVDPVCATVSFPFPVGLVPTITIQSLNPKSLPIIHI